MHKKEQIRIANELADSFKELLLDATRRCPEEWDGFEIRQLCSDIVSMHINHRKMNFQRIREYKNECLVNNLV